jgi:methyl-accepting chemotaxis protein
MTSTTGNSTETSATAATGPNEPDDLSAALLFGAHHVAAKSAERAVDQCVKANQGLQQCRSQIEAFTDLARRLDVRIRDTKSSVAQLSDALDRIKLVALNTGLEGARLGESSGKALVAVADEIRNLSSRGLDVVATHVRLVQEIELEQQKLAQTAELAQSLAMDLAALLKQTHESQCEAVSTLDALEANIERASGLDANAAADLQRVAEHGQGLVSALEALGSARRQKIIKTLLLPTVEPLLRALLATTQPVATEEPKP